MAKRQHPAPTVEGAKLLKLRKEFDETSQGLELALKTISPDKVVAFCEGLKVRPTDVRAGLVGRSRRLKR